MLHPGPRVNMKTYPSECEQKALLRKLHHEVFFVDLKQITRRMLLRYQQGRNYIVPALVFAEK